MSIKSAGFAIQNFFKNISITQSVLILVGVGFLVYFNALFNGFVWDDIEQIQNNPLTHSISNIPSILIDHSTTFYRPLPLIVITLIYSIAGQSAFWFHVVLITLHTFNVSLLFILFKKHFGKATALFCALIYLVHPINAESVAYISSIQGVLSVFFGVSSLIVVTNEKLAPKYKYPLLFFLLLFSELSKEYGVLFLMLIPMYVFLCFKHTYKKDDYLYLGLVLFSVFVTYVTMLFLINPAQRDTTHSPVPIVNSAMLERLVTLPKIIFFYILTFSYPKDLAISQQWIVKKIDFSNFFIPLIADISFLGGMSVGAFYLKVKKSTRLGSYVFFATWFLLGLGIHSNIIPLDMTVAERWFYFPMIGLLGMLGLLGESIVKNTKSFLLIFISAVLILSLSVRTVMRNMNWMSNETLFNHDEKISANSYAVENEIAFELLSSAKYDEAKPHLDKSIQLAPDYWANWNNLGVYYKKKEKIDIDKAIAAFNQSTKNNPYYYRGNYNLALIYYQYKSPEETKTQLNEILHKYPNDDFFRYLMSLTYYRLEDKDNAIDEMLKAFKLNNKPNYADLYNAMRKKQEINIKEVSPGIKN